MPLFISLSPYNLDMMVVLLYSIIWNDGYNVIIKVETNTDRARCFEHRTRFAFPGQFYMFFSFRCQAPLLSLVYLSRCILLCCLLESIKDVIYDKESLLSQCAESDWSRPNTNFAAASWTIIIIQLVSYLFARWLSWMDSFLCIVEIIFIIKHYSSLFFTYNVVLYYLFYYCVIWSLRVSSWSMRV
jgi:hypothetical protein